MFISYMLLVYATGKKHGIYALDSELSGPLSSSERGVKK
jgi:hypothetical protein